MNAWTLLTQSTGPLWVYVAGLVVQAVFGGWFAHALKAERDILHEDGKKLSAGLAALKLEMIEVQRATTLHAADIGDLKTDWDRMQELVTIRLPKIVEDAVTRAEERGEQRALALAAMRRRRDRG